MTERKMKLEDWLDDLCVRFLMNGPKEDLETPERICFRVEEAQWYYEDFIRPLDPTLPSMTLRRFCEQMFAHCPLLSPFSQGEHMQAFEAFLTYKARIPVRGAIMLNDAMDHVVLVKGWKKGAAWSFPRGKINKDEDDLDCAIREVYEETGYDIESSGLVPDNRNVKSIELSMHEQQIRLFVFRDVPMDTHFEPRTRKEISKIMWWRISDLPAFKRKGQQHQPAPVVKANNFYMVAPFLGPLRKWVLDQKKMDSNRVVSNPYLSAGLSPEDTFTEEDQAADSNTEGFPYIQPPPSTQEINSLTGATNTLNRLLQIPQEEEEEEEEAPVQHAPLEHPPAKDSGSALLALLQSKPVQQTYHEPPPETPFDPTIEEAPMPPTPHHEVPRPPYFANMPPPPNFPPQSNFPPQPDFPPQPQDDEFFYDQPFLSNASRENMEAKYMQAQQHIQKRQLARQQSSPHHYQPQHLIHPQPLPPHVQRAVFTGGPVHSPVVPQPIPVQPPQHYNPTINMQPTVPQFPGLHAPMVPQVQKQSPPKLNSHSLALLNAFKNRDGVSGDNSDSKDTPLGRFEQETSPIQLHESQVQRHHQQVQHFHHQPEKQPPQVPHHQVQHFQPPPGKQQPQIPHQQPQIPHQQPQIPHQQPQIPHQQPQIPRQQPHLADRQPRVQPYQDRVENYLPQIQQRRRPQLPAEVSEAPEALHPHKMPQNINGSQGPSPPVLGPRKPPSEQQKSALLGLFKAPIPQAAPAMPPSATALPTTPTPSAVELSAVEPLSSNAATTSALLNDKRTPEHIDKALPEINPEANLPFRAMAILSRPAESNNQGPQVRKNQLHKPTSKPGGNRPINGTSFHAQPTNLPAFQPQILKRPSKSPPESAEQQEFVSLVKPLSGLQSNQPAEHKKNLLSLFAKSSPEPSHTLQRIPTGDNYSASPPFDAAPRSRVNNLASAESSRRSSQAPISPANKGFLLSYLDAVAKGAQ